MKRYAIILVGVWLFAVAGHAGSIVNTKHQLSASGPGPLRAASEAQICIFCHTPHQGAGEAPMWNRFSAGVYYTPYRSSTAKAVIGQPTGVSKLCLSCHDGTVALGMVRKSNLHGASAGAIALQGATGQLPPGNIRLDTDLSDDHPISFTFDSALRLADGQLKDPSTLTGPVRLSDGRVECTSCHSPHDDRFGKFLVVDNTGSALCQTCHDLRGWIASSHKLSPKTWNRAGVNPWPHTPYPTVADNGCENCHRPHTAGTKERLLNAAGEESNCYPCHNGNVAGKNIQREFGKLSAHPIDRTTGVHDPTEDPVNPPTRHVECVDCHDAHASTAERAQAPAAGGALKGVTGLNASGGVVRPIVNEYELCFRCHADSRERGPALVPRQVVQTNVRLEFDVANASYHPVEAAGKNGQVPSLISPWKPTSLVACTDCHTGDNPVVRGPHGSTFPPLLERQLVLSDDQAETPASYALCYKCHSRTSILSDQSFPLHSKHVVGARAACTTCHDPHGVAAAPHLINFNTSHVTGARTYTATGAGHGNCTLSCHGADHTNWSY